jgi:stage V sporulation protein B
MVKKMAKGTVFLMIAEVIFLGGGYLIHFGLARMMDPIEYGIYGIILALLSIIIIFLENGVPQSVSKNVAAGKDFQTIKMEGMKAQAFFLIIIFAIYFLSAPFLAEILGDQGLTPYIQLSALILPIRAIYLVFQGLLDGKREFKKHAGLRTSYSLSKMSFVLILVYLGLGIIGVIIGFIIASFIVLVMGSYFIIHIKEHKRVSKISWKELAIFSLPVILFSIMYTTLISVDVLFVKALIVAGEQTGYYTSSRLMASLPFYIFAALSFTLLPSIARSKAEKNLAQTREYISNSLRYYAMIIFPLIVFVIATAPNLLVFLFTPQYIAAGTSLRILSPGIAFLTGFYIMSFVLIGGGKQKTPMYILIGLVPLHAALNLILIPSMGIEGAALSTMVVGLIGLIVISIIVFKEFKTLMSPKSLANIAIGSGLVFIISMLLALQGFLLILLGISLFFAYIGFLYLIKEIKKEDIDIIKNVLTTFTRSKGRLSNEGYKRRRL